jgi:hypothetical protein
MAQLDCAVLVVVVLYSLMDRQLSRRMTENFMARGDVVAEALAKSVEPPLISHDLTSVQSSAPEPRTKRLSRDPLGEVMLKGSG